MKIVIWGAGAIGGCFGAWWARAGHEVIAVDKDAAHVAAINARGLQITGPVDAFTVPMRAYTPEDFTGQYDLICLCVKAHHTEAATRALQPHLSANGYVVSLQNGFNELVIGEIIGAERVVGAFINFGADYIEPGVIHRGNRASVVIGEMNGSITPRLEALYKLMLEFDDRAVLTQNMWGYLWGKMCYGALLFATALTHETIADALAMPDYRAMYIALGREVMALAAARHEQPEGFDGFDPRPFMLGGDDAAAGAVLDQLVAFNRKSAKTHTGIWRDLAVRKRKTEVDPQEGMMVKMGADLGVAVPLLTRMVDLVHEIEAGQREQGLETLRLLRDGM